MAVVTHFFGMLLAVVQDEEYLDLFTCSRQRSAASNGVVRPGLRSTPPDTGGCRWSRGRLGRGGEGGAGETVDGAGDGAGEQYHVE